MICNVIDCCYSVCLKWCNIHIAENGFASSRCIVIRIFFSFIMYDWTKIDYREI